MMKKGCYILLIISALFLVDCIFSTQVNGVTQAESTNLQNNIQNICPPNSYLKNGLCYCNEGLNWNVQGTQCVTYTQSCQSKYGPHVYGDQNYCYCEEGYVWNKERTKCITHTEDCQLIYGEHVLGRKGDEKHGSYCDCEEGYVWDKERTKCITYTESCYFTYGEHTIGRKVKVDKENIAFCDCEEGYVWNKERTKCITHTEDCQLIYGEHVLGRKGDEKHGSYCDCEEGYVWNLSKSQCIPEFEALVEYFTPFNLLAFILGLIPILIWFLVIKLIIKFVFKTKLSIKKSLIFFGAGMTITPFVWFLENYPITLLHLDIKATLPFVISAFVYLGIAAIEELSKFFTAFLILKTNKYFDEAIDAMIYLIVLALGFGVVENILIVYEQIALGEHFLSTFQILSLRFIGANLLHALSSGIIGFFWAQKLITGEKRYLTIGLLLGILLHWVFNLAIMNLGGEVVFLIALVLTILLVIFFFTIKKFAPSLQKHLA